MIKQGQTIYVCDFCGIESTKKDFATELESGSSTIEIKGGFGHKMMDQSWGGNNINTKDDMCFSCANVVIEEIENIKVRLKRTSL